MLGRFYQWLWFRFEFWLTPVNRRPLTFIFRDWIYTHTGLFAVLVMIFYAGVVILSIWHGTTSTIITSVVSFILAHLVWGSAYLEGQQEFPTYLGKED